MKSIEMILENQVNMVSGNVKCLTLKFEDCPMISCFSGK